MPGTRVTSEHSCRAGWAIYEVEMFTNSDCSSGRLAGDVIASGYAPPLEENGPSHAIDGILGPLESDWNRRPAAANTMWRLFYLSRKDEACPNQLTRNTERPWGVADLKFFTDDDCLEQITGGDRVQNSLCVGRYEEWLVVDQVAYDSSRLTDADQLTTWGANCRTGFRLISAENTDCHWEKQRWDGGEWVNHGGEWRVTMVMMVSMVVMANGKLVSMMSGDLMVMV
eukprot:Skav216625  [mRNA]  locus=scaffold3008:396450:403267:- [translate_table: standard]